MWERAHLLSDKPCEFRWSTQHRLQVYLQESGKQSQAQLDQVELPLASTPEKDDGLSLRS
jgi:hypothetical protein